MPLLVDSVTLSDSNGVRVCRKVTGLNYNDQSRNQLIAYINDAASPTRAQSSCFTYAEDPVMTRTYTKHLLGFGVFYNELIIVPEYDNSQLTLMCTISSTTLCIGPY